MSKAALSVVFAGSGGAGAMIAGSILLRSAAEAGYYGVMTQLFGPQVRGGDVKGRGLCEELGFTVSTDPGDPHLRLATLPV